MSPPNDSRTRPAEDVDDHWWGCPECPTSKGPDDVYNAGRTHVAACHTHRTTWILGANLFSSWRDETEAEQRARYAEIEGYRRVEDEECWRVRPPVFWPRTDSGDYEVEGCPF